LDIGSREGSKKLYFKTLVKLSVSSLPRFTGESLKPTCWRCGLFA